MKSKFIKYNFRASERRIDQILETKDKVFEEVDNIPSRGDLRFYNGFYINKTSALFVDIRKSSELPKEYKRPVLARIYRSYISEVVAIINGNINCKEININGDCVWGVFDARIQKQLDSVLSTAKSISSIIKFLNYKYEKKGIKPLTIGIGLAFGRVLMIKAGYQGSLLNDVVWMGDVVNESSNLCSNANKNSVNKEIVVSKEFWNRLNDENKELLKLTPDRSCYHGNASDKQMDEWFNKKYKLNL